MTSDTNPRVKCHYCNKDVIHQKFYSHVASKHFDDFWTSENKGKVEDALKSRKVEPIPLVVKGYDLFLYYSPVSGRLYSKLKSAQASLTDKTEEQFKAPLRSLFSVKTPSLEKGKVVVKEVIKVVKEEGLSHDENLALRRLLHNLYQDLRDARERADDEIPEDETLLSYCEDIPQLKKEVGYLKTISLVDSVKCMTETHTGEKPQKKIEIEESSAPEGDLSIFFDDEEPPKPAPSEPVVESQVKPSDHMPSHTPPEPSSASPVVQKPSQQSDSEISKEYPQTYTSSPVLINENQSPESASQSQPPVVAPAPVVDGLRSTHRSVIPNSLFSHLSYQQPEPQVPAFAAHIIHSTVPKAKRPVKKAQSAEDRKLF